MASVKYAHRVKVLLKLIGRAIMINVLQFQSGLLAIKWVNSFVDGAWQSARVVSNKSTKLSISTHLKIQILTSPGESSFLFFPEQGYILPRSTCFSFRALDES